MEPGPHTAHPLEVTEKLCIRAGEKTAEMDAAARNANKEQRIGSLRRSSVFRARHSVRTSDATPISTITRKKMFRGTTYGKKKPEGAITGTSSDAMSRATIAARHEIVDETLSISRTISPDSTQPHFLAYQERSRVHRRTGWSGAGYEAH